MSNSRGVYSILSTGCRRSVISRMKLFPPGQELRLFYVSLPGSFFVVGSPFISVSLILGRKKGNKYAN